MAGRGQGRFPGAGDCLRGRSRELHHRQDRLAAGRAEQQGPGGPAMLLLPRAGPQVHGVLTHQPAHEDQAHLRHRWRRVRR